MATSNAITQTIQQLEDTLVTATNLAQCFNDATATSDAPPWVFLFTRQIHDLDAKASQLIEDVTLKCLPLMKEMESLTRKN